VFKSNLHIFSIRPNSIIKTMFACFALSVYTNPHKPFHYVVKIIGFNGYAVQLI